MTLTPTRKLLLGVVGIGGIALVVDQFVLGPDSGPSKAAADVSPASLEVKPGERTLPKAEPGMMISGKPAVGGERVAVRLAALSFAAEGPTTPDDEDAFAPPATWRSVMIPPKPASEKSASKSASETPAEKGPDFRLTMIAKRGGEAFAAVINGKLLKIGESIDGYRLVAVSATGVDVDGNDDTAKPVLAVLEGEKGRIELGIEPNLKARPKD